MSELTQIKQPIKQPAKQPPSTPEVSAVDPEFVETLTATDEVSVTNTSDRRIHLTNIILEPGDSGLATFAEYTSLAQFLTRG